MAFVAYPVEDMERAEAFYRDTIGLKPAERFGDYWVEFDIGDATFAVVQANEEMKMPAGTQFSAAFEVDDVKSEHARLSKLDLRVSEVFEFPVCWVIFVTDPDGNRFGLHQRKQQG